MAAGDTRDLAAQLRNIADRVRRLPAIDHRRPHAFTEQKDEIAHEIELLASKESNNA